MLSSNWKSNIFFQLKEQNIQRNGYQKLIERYNYMLENNLILQTHSNALEKDINHLRLVNADLEKIAESTKELENIKGKLNTANDEVMSNLREKGELAREVLRLNHTLADITEKLAKEEIKIKEYRDENELLNNKLKETEYQLNEILQIHQILQDEFQGLKTKNDQLQIEYNKMKPTYVELEQQLESTKRKINQLEDEVLITKNQQAAMLDYENEKFLERIKQKPEIQKSKEVSVFFDDDMVFIPSIENPLDNNQDSASSSNSLGDAYNNLYYSRDELLPFDRKGSGHSCSSESGNLWSRLTRKFINETNNYSSDRLYRTSANCTMVSVPMRVKTSWNCTDLEVYALQYQPSGSILATGGSDKVINLWEISSTGQQEKYCSLQGSQGAINAIDFDNEGCRTLAGSSGDKTYIWSYGEQKVIKDILTGHQGSIYTCKFISNKKIVTGSADRTIKIWDLCSRHCIQTIFAGSKCHDLVITDAAGTIISGHYDKKIRIWDPFTNICRSELAYDASITSLSYNDEKQRLLACLKDDTLKLIDLRQNRTIYTFSHDNFKVSTDTHKAVLSPDATYACVGSHDGSLVVFNMDTNKCENVSKQKHNTMVTSVAWQPDGKYVASCEKHRQVFLWYQ